MLRGGGILLKTSMLWSYIGIVPETFNLQSRVRFPVRALRDTVVWLTGESHKLLFMRSNRIPATYGVVKRDLKSLLVKTTARIIRVYVISRPRRLER